MICSELRPAADFLQTQPSCVSGEVQPGQRYWLPMLIFALEANSRAPVDWFVTAQELIGQVLPLSFRFQSSSSYRFG